MWLRTSAGSTAGFDMFLCYGEGIYADCLEWTDVSEKWPAGDEVPEGEEDEDETVALLADLAMIWDKPQSANSAPLM